MIFCMVVFFILKLHNLNETSIKYPMVLLMIYKLIVKTNNET